jgi:hypothetical protein
VLIAKQEIHNWVACTAKTLGLSTRANLVNKSDAPALVDVRIYSSDGMLLGEGAEIGCIPAQSTISVSFTDLAARLAVADGAGDRVYLFALYPDKYRDSNQPIEIELKDLQRLVAAQDHYLEHCDPVSGFASGVLYQARHINDSRFGKGAFSFLMQAPKVFLSEQRNTLSQLIFYSTDRSLAAIADVLFRVRDERGTCVAEWHRQIAAHGMMNVDVKKSLTDLGVDWRTVVNRHGFLFLEAYCAEYSFVTVTININEQTRAFDMEHTLPPTYYSKVVRSDWKRELVREGLRSLR